MLSYFVLCVSFLIVVLGGIMGRMQNVIMLNVRMLNVMMLNVKMLSV